MSLSVNDLAHEASKLPVEEKEELLRLIIIQSDVESPEKPDEVAKAWSREIEDRINDIDSGQVKLVPADEVFRRMREKRRARKT